MHLKHCEALDLPGATAADIAHFSSLYGVNRKAALNNLQYFNVASGALVSDIMHDVLEGVLPLETKLMLKVCIYVSTYLYKLHIIEFYRSTISNCSVYR